VTRLNKAYVIFGFALLLIFIQTAYPAVEVTVKFFYFNPRTDPTYCETCNPEPLNDFLEKNNTLTEISKNYTGRVSVVWKEFYINYVTYTIDPGVYNEMVAYNATDPTGSPESNSIVILDGKGNFTTFKGYVINKTDFETRIKQTIDAYLAGLEPPPPSSAMPLFAILAGAFSFGFLETFSPCLLILLSFVLSYSIKETTSFKEGFLKVMTFGAGFIFATILVFLGSVGLVIASSAFAFQNVLMYIVLVLAVFFGVSLLGLDVPKFLKLNIETKPVIQKLSRKFVITYAGLVMLGFLFYFLDPCIAPVFVVMLGTFQQALIGFLPLVLLVFCLGVIVPFIGVGILAGSISKLTRSTYRNQYEIKAISGIILIIYAIYFIGFSIMKLGLTTTLIIDATVIAPVIFFVVARSLRSRHA
jgi:cytochrome c biogenesis protein CcdA